MKSKQLLNAVQILIVTFFLGACDSILTKPVEKKAPWQADLGNGFYQNPILYADYSDPDVVAVGDDFYMTASSFNAAPGLPILHSKDLVNWQLINYALPVLIPENVFAVPQHGNGVWAPNIRYHDGFYWIFYPDPDYGIYVIKTQNPAGAWSKPTLILPGKGLIDPTPLWNDDGKAYLLHGWAKSRAGFNNILTLHSMSWDVSTVESNGHHLIDANAIPGYKTLEGPKFYKRNGYYYIFAPEGGVPVGTQAVFRAKNIQGPYEFKKVMVQGTSSTNGPHQGAWISTSKGEDWFVHFQSRGAHGRIVHLQPMHWKNDWPVIGVDSDNDGVGNPVQFYKKPDLPTQKVSNLPFMDSFDKQSLGLQWQWNSNFQTSWYSLNDAPGYLRLFATEDVAPLTQNLWLSPAILLQKLPAPKFIAQTRLVIPEGADNLMSGMVLLGEDYRWVGVKIENGVVTLGFAECRDARSGCQEIFKPVRKLESQEITLRFFINEGGLSVSGFVDGEHFEVNDELFQARPGRWVGAKIGLFVRAIGKSNGRFLDFDYFNIEAPTECCIK